MKEIIKSFLIFVCAACLMSVVISALAFAVFLWLTKVKSMIVFVIPFLIAFLFAGTMAVHSGRKK